ncbi:MAG: FAD binding domain-containing protein [Gaiellaceae bacterium]
MIPARVEYVRASSLDEALNALAEPDAKLLAGGQSLLPVLKLRIARPSVLVDIGRLELGGIDTRDGELWIGALTTWDELAGAPELEQPALAAVSECAAGIGDLQVRNRGTVGGSLAHADPASDMPAVLLALGAWLVVGSPTGERTVGLAEFFHGPFTTALAARELITAVVVPAAPAGSGSAYVSVEHPASGFALAGAAALVGSDGSSTVAVTGVGSRPCLIPADDHTVEALAEAEVYGDRFAPAEYRRHLAGVVVGRALERARERAEEAR